MENKHVPGAALTGAKAFGRARNVILISAQTGAPDVSAPMARQLQIAVAKVTAALDAAGADFSYLLKLGVFYDQKLVSEEPHMLATLRSLLSDVARPVVTAIPLPHIPQGASVQIEAVAVDPAGRSDTLRATPGRYGFSSAVRYGDLVYVGAQMSKEDGSDTEVQDDIVAQAKVAIGNIDMALRSLGSDLSCVSRLNTYYMGVGTASDWALAAKVRSDAFVKPGPGATGIPIPGPYPKGHLIRQEAMGVVNEDGTAAPRKTSWPKGVWDWPIPVSFQQGVEVNGLILPGGQVAMTTRGVALFPNDLRRQTVNTMGCIASILGGLGQNFDCVSKATIFYATDGSAADVDMLADCIAPFFGQGLPAVTLVPLEKLGVDNVEIEIEVIGSV